MASAHHGMRDWLLQRGTAVVMALYLLMLTILLMTSRPINHEIWQRLLHQPWMKIATLLFLYSLFLHAWLGVKNVLTDYTRPGLLRLGLQGLVVAVLLSYAAWTVRILWGAH